MVRSFTDRQQKYQREVTLLTLNERNLRDDLPVKQIRDTNKQNQGERHARMSE